MDGDSVHLHFQLRYYKLKKILIKPKYFFLILYNGFRCDYIFSNEISRIVYFGNCVKNEGVYF